MVVVFAGLDFPDALLKVFGARLDVFSIDASSKLGDVILWKLPHASAGAQAALDAVEGKLGRLGDVPLFDGGM